MAARTPSGESCSPVARPSPDRVGVATGCGGPDAGTRTTWLPSRTTQVSSRVADTLGRVRLAADSARAGAPPAGPTRRLAPPAPDAVAAIVVSEPSRGSAEPAAPVRPYTPVPAGPGTGFFSRGGAARA